MKLFKSKCPSKEFDYQELNFDITIGFTSLICSADNFTINGVDADVLDFGERDNGGTDNYACLNMKFEIIEPTKEVLEEYRINEKEYYVIAKLLRNTLSFGACSMCV